jgi:hypothetical protein
MDKSFYISSKVRYRTIPTILITSPEEEGTVLFDFVSKKSVKKGIIEAIYLQVLCKES